MSANIYWRPVSKNNKSLNVPAPSSFQEKMSGVGLTLPCTVRQGDKRLLEGMAAGYGFNKDQPNPFQEIVDLLEKYDEIELWAEY